MSSAATLGKKKPMPTTGNLIEIENLKVSFTTDEGTVKAVDGVYLNIAPNQTHGIVGESGCGKSVTAMSILRLLPERTAKVDGRIMFHYDERSIDLADPRLKEESLRRIRGRDISMIFQEPMTSLNPVFSIGNQLMEGILLHQHVDRRQARSIGLEMLKKVGIPAPERRIHEYPHQLSGGMRQRVMIAMALACNPALLIADEPTTALDVTVQAQILNLMQDLQKEFETSIIMITHDLGVIAETADNVSVMYLGQVVEESSASELFHDPQHPYTKALLESIPRFQSIREKRLEPIKGRVPEADKIPAGCRFGPRCLLQGEHCEDDAPHFFEIKPGHRVRCWLCR